MNGKRILEKKINAEETLIDISEFEKGVYLIYVHSEKTTEIVKIIKI